MQALSSAGDFVIPPRRAEMHPRMELQRNKTDKNSAGVLARLMRSGWHRTGALASPGEQSTRPGVACECVERIAPVSLLKKPSGHEIGVPMKAMVDDVRCSNRAPLSCVADSPHVF